MTEFNDGESFDIYVHEVEDNGDIDAGRKCPISDFHGVVPAFGDVYIKPWDGLKPPYFAGKVIERYFIDDEDGGQWHIILHPIDLSPDRVKGLGLV
jgi:hypothetical protein